MLPVPAELEHFYDGQGRHLGGYYPALLAGNDCQLTNAHRALVANHPAGRVIANPLASGPGELGLVWFVPYGRNPLVSTSGAFGYVVHALDAGQCVMLHAQDDATIDGICATVTAMLGGGHA